MITRLHVYYSGNVQGVGFRFSACDIAARFDITGWVRNMPDGRVEILAEGEEKNLKKFLAEIEDEMKLYIKDMTISWTEPTGEFRAFDMIF